MKNSRGSDSKFMMLPLCACVCALRHLSGIDAINLFSLSCTENLIVRLDARPEAEDSMCLYLLTTYGKQQVCGKDKEMFIPVMFRYFFYMHVEIFLYFITLTQYQYQQAYTAQSRIINNIQKPHINTYYKRVYDLFRNCTLTIFRHARFFKDVALFYLEGTKSRRLIISNHSNN